MAMKLRARIALVAAAAVAVAVVLASVAAYFAARNELRGEVDASLAERAVTVAGIEGLRMRAGRPLPGGPFGLQSRFFDPLYYQWVNEAGFAVAPPNAELLLPLEENDVEVAARRRDAFYRDVTVDGVHLRMVTVPAGAGEAIQLARPLTEVDATLRGLAVVLVFVGVGGVGVAALLGLAVARSALRPVGRLTAAAEHVAETQELAARIDVGRDDEVGRLASSFNAMLAALEESRTQQRRLVDDASHELRTPLTALRANLELLARADGLPDDERRRLMEDVTFELEELSALVGELVELATDARVHEEVEELSLDELVERAVERARRRTGRVVHLSTTPSWVRGRPIMLERAVGNLLDNADKWAPPDTPIEVEVGEGRVEVRDRGPGIDQQDRPYIFDRFYRASTARSMPGSGLGLAIVKQIVDQHHGEVFAAQADGGGAAVGFTLPEMGESQ